MFNSSLNNSVKTRPDLTSAIDISSTTYNVVQSGFVAFKSGSITNDYTTGQINGIVVSFLGSSGYQQLLRAGFYRVISGDTVTVANGKIIFYGEQYL